MIDHHKEEAKFVIANQALVDALLAMNTHNRKPKPSAVSMYKKDMQLGTFLPTNQGIGVSKSGILIDGQNRLIAIKELGYPPIKFLLVTGLDDAAQHHVDTHSRRTQADILKLALNQSASTLAIAALNARQMFISTTVADRLTIDQLSEQLIEHHDQLAAIISLVKSHGKAGVVAPLLDYAIRGSDAAALALAEKIGSGENLSRTDPAYKIRQYLDTHKVGGAQAILRMYRTMISACVADWLGKPITTLRETDSWPALKTRRSVSTSAGNKAPEQMGAFA